MSSVYARNRKKTPFDAVDFAAALQDAITKHCGDEKYVPKKWRLLIGQDLISKGELTAEDVRASYASWKGSMKGKDAYRTVKRMDALYNKIIINEWREQEYG